MKTEQALLTERVEDNLLIKQLVYYERKRGRLHTNKKNLAFDPSTCLSQHEKAEHAKNFKKNKPESHHQYKELDKNA